MEIILLSVNKTKNQNIKNLLDDYKSRISHYVKFSFVDIPDMKNSKNISPKELRIKEGALIKEKIKIGDLCILLDESGVNYSSINFSEFLNKKYNSNHKRIVFIVGSAYGFSESIYLLGNEKISLSKMTFTHQMTRLFFCEQLYRANTILRNEKYHHI